MAAEIGGKTAIAGLYTFHLATPSHGFYACLSFSLSHSLSLSLSLSLWRFALTRVYSQSKTNGKSCWTFSSGRFLVVVPLKKERKRKRRKDRCLIRCSVSREPVEDEVLLYHLDGRANVSGAIFEKRFATVSHPFVTGEI